MLKHFMKFILALVLITAANAQALPIIDADAFVPGDHKAALEIGTGLTWMDFGVNNKDTYSQVVNKLDTDYQGWRLPTADEVRHLWISLFSGLPGFFTLEPNFGAAEGYNFRSEFKAIFNVIGYNEISTFSIVDDFDTGNVIESWPIYWSSGVFDYGNGHGGTMFFFSPLENDSTHDYQAMFMELTGGDDISSWNGTLLVKADQTSVPEPASFLLVSIGLIGTYIIRRRRQA